MVSPERSVELPVLRREVLAARDARLTGALLVLSLVAVAVVDAALIARGYILAGVIADGVLLILLLNISGWRRASDPTTGAALSAMRALALIPLARVAAAGMPIAHASPPLADLLVVVPVAYAAIRFAPLVGVGIGGLFGGAVSGPRASRVRVIADTGVTIAGGVLGLVAYELGAPSLIPVQPSGGRVVLAAAAVTAIAVVEEVVFRGLLQTTLQRLDVRIGFLVASALFACGYLAAGSPALVLTFALAGLVFGYAYALSGSLRGPVAGHWALALGAFVEWPGLHGVHSTALQGQTTTFVLAVLVGAGAVAGAAQLGAGARSRHAGPDAH
jgi:membrane protease YdiL (CAAX protease family)